MKYIDMQQFWYCRGKQQQLKAKGTKHIIKSLMTHYSSTNNDNVNSHMYM
jgi:hypothetical protein